MIFRRYPVDDMLLKSLVKYFWVLDSQHDLIVKHDLLPVGNIDFILNFSSPISYVLDDDKEIIPRGFHFNGLRNKQYRIQQSGRLQVIGISFFAMGLYPILKMPLSEFTNRTIELETVDQRFALELQNKLNWDDSLSKKLDIIEKTLVQFINQDMLIASPVFEIVNNLYANTEYIMIGHYCEKYGINRRKLERIFSKYIGVSPKSFQRLSRFQKVINQIINNDYTSLTRLALDYNFYDQTHFIKEFKSFTGCSPSQFIDKRTSVKEIIHSS